MTSTRWARFTRGWLVAGTATFVAALSHTLGGGSVPGVLPVVISLAFAGMVCIGLSGRTLSLWRLTVSVVASQAVFHTLFSLGAQVSGAVGDAGFAASAAHHLTQPEIARQLASTVPSAPSGLSDTGAGMAGMNHGDTMVVAHIVAAIVTIALLRRGEGALLRLLELAHLGALALFSPAVAVTVPDVAPAPVPSLFIFRPRELGVVLSSMRHRGPPATAATV
ncbi:hypothetical protein [Luethyella okanaganae]|uniref:Uncharacterized protein n=1 Tax=Luethyella okanaganae TaxID=69372 RepID=A0ABW1VIM1_9MICO